MSGKLKKEALEQVSGGVILKGGYICKNCKKEFSVGIPDNKQSWDPRGIGFMPTKKDRIKDWQHTHYCFECLRDPTVKKEEPEIPSGLYM